MHQITVESPLGQLEIVEDEGVIARLHIGKNGGGEIYETPLLQEAKAQIGAYFERRKTRFDLPLAPAATAFQQRMRNFMLAIPSGETRSYGEAATSLASAPRAVGQACVAQSDSDHRSLPSHYCGRRSNRRILRWRGTSDQTPPPRT